MPHVRDLAGFVQVDGLKYEWNLRREPQWCTADGWKGMKIVLRLQGAQREVHLQFPMPSASRSKLQPQLRRPQVDQRIIENGIRSALAGGWDPGSRGKPLVVEVDTSGC
jgi:hypothetical protein